jgi:arsenite methyltransferase
MSQQPSHPPTAPDPHAVRATVRTEYARIATAQRAGCCGPGALQPIEASRLGYEAAQLEGLPAGADLGLGCGNPQAIAALRLGETVLDLGAGAGFDALIAARAVGPEGAVIGVDMTPEMVVRARANAAAAGIENASFWLGEIEHLPVADQSVDVILSNCVINLSPEKGQVFREAFRALRPGGRLAISDVVALRPLPAALVAQAEALVGCVAGAATVAELEAALVAAGFAEVAIQVRPESRAFIADWLPGSGAEEYVASATIEARRPARRCCG